MAITHVLWGGEKLDRPVTPGTLLKIEHDHEDGHGLSQRDR
ncbi:MAG: hypothetical protein ABIO86_00895 [Sphingomonas sp.]